MLTSTLLLIRPAAFGFNPDAAATNVFQADDGHHAAAEVAARAAAEFDAFTAQLRAAGVEVVVFQDPGTPVTPDSLFPNNWVSFHPGGHAVLYPMQPANRRPERRPAVFDALAAAGHPFPHRLDLSAWEATDWFLEGTGSLVLDRRTRRAYAALGPRTHPAAVAAWATQLGYTAFAFHAVDAHGVPIYHTNVLLSVGETVALACLDALPDPAERAALEHHLRADAPDRLLVPLSFGQLGAFAGNALQVRTTDAAPLLVLSAQAWAALTGPQQAAIKARTGVLAAPLPTIEQYGGGSARCMLAEVGW